MFTVRFTVEQVVDQHHLNAIQDAIDAVAYVAGIEVLNTRIEED